MLVRTAGRRLIGGVWGGGAPPRTKQQNDHVLSYV